MKEKEIVATIRWHFDLSITQDILWCMEELKLDQFDKECLVKTIDNIMTNGAKAQDIQQLAGISISILDAISAMSEGDEGSSLIDIFENVIFSMDKREFIEKLIENLTEIINEQ